MNAHVLLNLLNKLGKSVKMQGLPSALSHFRSKFNKFNNIRAGMLDLFLSYDIKVTLTSHFCRKNVIILSLCMQCCYGHHNVSQKSVNHQWFIDFIAWRYFIPRHNVI